MKFRRPVTEDVHLVLELDEQALQLLHRIAVAKCVPIGRTLAQQLAVSQTDQLLFDTSTRQRGQETRRLAVVTLALVVWQQLKSFPLSILQNKIKCNFINIKPQNNP